MLQNATIVIPDISGFTDFLTKTELEHSSHIINELLDLLIHCNTVELTLLEVEGDALLFYRKGDPIALKLIIQQCISMFENFHKQIRIIERDSICQCGACQTASNLSLKFIIHYGTVKELMVAGFKKASGVDMVIAHRLLKNRIDSSEYILMTQNYLNNLSDKQPTSDFTWQFGNEEYPAIGKVEYEYALLDGVKSRIPSIPERVEQVIESSDNIIEVEIKCPIHDVYHEIIDVDRRSNWVLGSQVTEREEVTERIGLKHLCLYQEMIFEINIVESRIGESEILYAEDLRTVESGTRFRHTYSLSRLSEMRTRLRFGRKYIDGPEMPQEINNNILILLKRNLEVFKNLCEKNLA
jgi:hypothetical protein